jgi:hypothetical protein
VKKFTEGKDKGPLKQYPDGVLPRPSPPPPRHSQRSIRFSRFAPDPPDPGGTFTVARYAQGVVFNDAVRQILEDELGVRCRRIACSTLPHPAEEPQPPSGVPLQNLLRDFHQRLNRAILGLEE